MAKPARKGRPRPKESGLELLEDRLETVERAVEEIYEAHSRIESALAEINRKLGPPKLLQAQLLRAQRSLDSLTRSAFLDPSQLGFPERLTIRRFSHSSQAGEDGILLAIFESAGVETRLFVEVGCGINGGNSGLFAHELRWSGLMIDADPATLAECAKRFTSERVKVVDAWVTAEGIDQLLLEHEMGGELDLLSIDVDGNDFWIWEALTAASPRVVVIEYNALFGPERSVVIPYDPEFERPLELRAYFGASLRALTRLGRKKGFRLVAVEPDGANAFFVRNDVAPAIPTVDPGDAFRTLRSASSIYPFRSDSRREGAARSAEDLFTEIDDRGLSLIEVE
jgi:hypothetical protein